MHDLRRAATSLTLRTTRKTCLPPCAPFPISPGFDPVRSGTSLLYLVAAALEREEFQ